MIKSELEKKIKRLESIINDIARIEVESDNESDAIVHRKMMTKISNACAAILKKHDYE